jgi:hypothetical protein
MTACQDWGKRRVEMIAEDTKHILDDTQNLMQMNALLCAKAWQWERPGGSS